MEPSYDAESVKARRQRRIARTRIAAAVASGVTFGAAVAGFALHDDDNGKASTVSSTTATTTFDQGNGDVFGSSDGTFSRPATPRRPSGRVDTGTRGS